MILKKLRSRAGRVIVAVVCALGILVPAWGAMPSAHAAVNPCTPIHVASYSWEIPWNCGDQPVPNSKACTTFAHTDVILNQTEYGTECATVWVQNDPYGVEVWSEGTFYCSGYWTQCGGMNVSTDLSYTDCPAGFAYPCLPARTVNTGHYKCNPNPGPACPGAAGATFSSARGGIATGEAYNVRAWDPYDGWNGNPNVLLLKGDTVATHVTWATNSQNEAIVLLPYNS